MDDQICASVFFAATENYPSKSETWNLSDASLATCLILELSTLNSAISFPDTKAPEDQFLSSPEK